MASSGPDAFANALYWIALTPASLSPLSGSEAPLHITATSAGAFQGLGMLVFSRLLMIPVPVSGRMLFLSFV